MSDALHYFTEANMDIHGVLEVFYLKSTESRSLCTTSLRGENIKQRRISYSSFGAEIIPTADNDDMGHFLKEALNELFQTGLFRH